MRNCTREMKEGLRVRQSGADLKPPQAVVVKSDGGERCGNAGTRIRQARLREASASKPSMKCRKRITRCQNRGEAAAFARWQELDGAGGSSRVLCGARETIAWA